MLIADSAIREEGTGKISLLGIFEEVRAPDFPVMHPMLAVYVKMPDAEGTYRFVLELVRLDDATKIGEGRGDFQARDRMAAGELVFRLHNLLFPAPGLYEFRLLADEHWLGGKTFRVMKTESPGG